MKTVLVFKTSISKLRQVRKLEPRLNRLMHVGDRWNFDLEDCDNILRIESQKIKAETISVLLDQNGFFCEELH